MPGLEHHDSDLEDDELDELPPLDGDPRDQPDPEPEYTDLLEDAGDDATLDDATGEDDPPDTDELDLNEDDGGWLDEAGEAQDLDLGDLAVVDFGAESSLLQESEEGGPEDDPDFGFGDAPERGGLDAGEEGPVDADEELREADLPALDADEEGDVDDAALLDPAFASDEPLGLPWAVDPWSRVGAPIGLAGARAVACAARGALALGRLEGGTMELVRVDLEGSCDRLAAEGLRAADVRSLAVEGSRVAAVTQSGRLFLSLDAGSTFVPVADIAEGLAVSDAVLEAGRLWLCTRTGGLLVFGSTSDSAAPAPVGPIERCPVPGMAIGITCDTMEVAQDAGRVAVLVVDDRGRPTALVRGGAERPMTREMMDAPEARSPAILAVRGGYAAYAGRHGGVVRRSPSGQWSPFEWEGTVTALCFVDDVGALVAAIYSDSDDTTAFVRLDATGRASVVARVGGVPPDSDADGRVAALAYDEARGVVWVAGGFGLTTFAVR
jgi:hypothetical protein